MFCIPIRKNCEVNKACFILETVKRSQQQLWTKDLCGHPETSTAAEGPTWHRGPQSHEHHRSDRVLEANGAAEVWGQVPDDGSKDSDDDYGHDEAGPAVPVLCGRDAGKQNLPEHSQEVHDVIETRWQPLLARFILFLVWTKNNNKEHLPPKFEDSKQGVKEQLKADVNNQTAELTWSIHLIILNVLFDILYHSENLSL